MRDRQWKREGGEKISSAQPVRETQETTPKKKQVRVSTLKLLWSYFWRISGWVWAIMVGGSVALAFFVLRSDVTINPRGRLKNDDLFSTLFSVTNEGTFAIKNVRFSCHMNDVEITNYRIRLIDQEGAADPRGEPEILGRKSQDVDCMPGALGYGMKPPPGGPTPEYQVADVTLTVCYRPHFWPSEIKQAERFIGRTDGSHRIVEWSHQASDVGTSFDCP